MQQASLDLQNNNIVQTLPFSDQILCTHDQISNSQHDTHKFLQKLPRVKSRPCFHVPIRDKMYARRNYFLRLFWPLKGATFVRVISASSTHDGNPMQSKWNLCAWLRVFTLHASNIKEFCVRICARASCVDEALTASFKHSAKLLGVSHNLTNRVEIEATEAMIFLCSQIPRVSDGQSQANAFHTPHLHVRV